MEILSDEGFLYVAGGREERRKRRKKTGERKEERREKGEEERAEGVSSSCTYMYMYIYHGQHKKPLSQVGRCGCGHTHQAPPLTSCSTLLCDASISWDSGELSWLIRRIWGLI